jgi:hypothetical protein
MGNFFFFVAEQLEKTNEICEELSTLFLQSQSLFIFLVDLLDDDWLVLVEKMNDVCWLILCSE